MANPVGKTDIADLRLDIQNI